MPTLNPGTVIADRYEVVRLIGEGGMGEVWEGRHVTIGRRLAIKFLNSVFARDKEALERFQQEARIAGTLGHTNICEVMDFGMGVGGAPYLVMEYMEGQSLADAIKVQGHLSVERSLHIIRQVLSALEEAHSNGIIHRDMKPENVFLANIKGQGEVVKLLDFGISKIMRTNESSMRLTKTGALVGTPFYMSPEQVRGRSDIDQRSDIYACGVMLYEMMTGRVPFGGTTFNEIIIRIIEDPFPDPTEEDGIPAEIKAFLRTTMDRSPENRPQTAGLFRQQIEAFMGLSAAPQGVAAAPAGVPAVRDDTGATSTRVSLEESSSDIVPPRRTGLIVFAVVASLVLLAGLGVGAVFLFGKAKGAGADGAGGQAAAAGAGGEKARAGMPAEPVPVRSVRIEVTDLPEGATVTWNGKPVQGNVIETPSSGDKASVAIRAEGFAPGDIEVTPDRDMTVSGKLVPLAPSAGAGEQPGEQPSEPKKKKKSGTDTSTQEKGGALPLPDGEPGAKPKKKKPAPVWDYPG